MWKSSTAYEDQCVYHILSKQYILPQFISLETKAEKHICFEAEKVNAGVDDYFDAHGHNFPLSGNCVKLLVKAE